MTEHPESKLESPGKKYEFLVIILLAIVAFLIYGKTLTGDFIFDDVPNIKDNPHLRIRQITVENLMDAAFEGPSKRRPVAKLSFALNHYFHGYNVAGFHIVNILIHIANSVLLYLLAAMTWRTPAMRPYRDRYRWIPLFSALIWLVHPIQTGAVSYIVQRMTSLATMFYMLSLLSYVQARFETGRAKKAAWFCAMAVCGLLALGSKEISATLPVFVFIYEWYFFQDLSIAWLKKRSPFMLAVLILLIVIVLIYLGGNPFDKLSSMYAAHPLTMAQRSLSQFRIVPLYISLLLWPHPARLNLDYDFKPSLALIDPATTLLGMTAILSLLVVAVITAKKHRLVSFGILWYFGNLAIESSVVALELVFEHRNYLPSIMFILLGVFLCFRYLKPRWLPPLLLAIIAGVCAFWSFERNEVWRSPLLIWKDTISKSPNDPRPYTNLGVALYDRGYYDLAVEQYRHALKLDPEFVNAHTNIGQVLAKMGNIDEAVEHLSRALQINPNHYEAHNNLGIIFAMQEEDQQALEHFAAALKINPDYPQAYNNMGVALKKQKRFQEAIAHIEAALKLDPKFVAAHNNMGLTLAEQGHLDEAIIHYKKALEIDPNNETAYKAFTMPEW